MSHETAELLQNGFLFGVIKLKAQRLVEHHGFPAQDQADLEHDLWVRILGGLAAFNPERGHPKAFTATLSDRALASLLRQAGAQCRAPASVVSLNQPVMNGDDAANLSEAIDDRQRHRRLQRDPRSDEEVAELINDVADLLAALPEDLREIAQRLMAQSRSAVARDMGMSRSAVAAAALRIRRRFEKSGFMVAD